MTIYNSSFNDKTGYVFNEDGSVKVIMKATGKEVEGITFNEQKVLEDAAKACIKNDIYVPEVESKAAKKEKYCPKPAPGYDCDLEDDTEQKVIETTPECSCNGYCGDKDCICEQESCEECLKEPKKEEVKTCYIGDVKKAEADVAKEIANQPIEVPDDIKHHLNAKDFGEYRIVISEYDDRDEIPFVGTKEELNKFIANLHLHVVPKVYKMIQLKVETKYEVL